MAEMASTPGVNIGNYKGVMLCNRPFNGVSTTQKASKAPSDGKAPFVSGLVKSTIGVNVPVSGERHLYGRRDIKNSALSKHKKWLFNLQRERERLEEALLEVNKKNDDKKQRFAEREAKMRASIRNAASSDSNAPEVDQEESFDAYSNRVEKEKKSSKQKQQQRPMWALTRESAGEEVERQEDEEVDALINFANNLDIDEFMDNVETKATIEQVKQRMEELQGIVNEEERAERKLQLEAERAENKVLGTLNAENLSRFFSKDQDDSKSFNIDDDNVTVASTILSECKSIRSVHSTRSVAALTKRAQSKMETINEREDGGLSVEIKPTIVVHDEEQGTRISIKKHPSNLPYIHRNPAI